MQLLNRVESVLGSGDELSTISPRSEATVRRAGGDGFDEAVAFEAAEHVIDGAWRSLPGVGDPLERAVDGLSVEAEPVKYEVVPGPGPDVMRAQTLAPPALLGAAISSFGAPTAVAADRHHHSRGLLRHNGPPRPAGRRTSRLPPRARAELTTTRSCRPNPASPRPQPGRITRSLPLGAGSTGPLAVDDKATEPLDRSKSCTPDHWSACPLRQ